MQPSKKSFFERLTGTVKLDEEAVEETERPSRNSILEESEEEGELSVDV